MPCPWLLSMNWRRNCHIKSPITFGMLALQGAFFLLRLSVAFLKLFLETFILAHSMKKRWFSLRWTGLLSPLWQTLCNCPRPCLLSDYQRAQSTVRYQRMQSMVELNCSLGTKLFFLWFWFLYDTYSFLGPHLSFLLYHCINVFNVGVSWPNLFLEGGGTDRKNGVALSQWCHFPWLQADWPCPSCSQKTLFSSSTAFFTLSNTVVKDVVMVQLLGPPNYVILENHLCGLAVERGYCWHCATQIGSWMQVGWSQIWPKPRLGLELTVL